MCICACARRLKIAKTEHACTSRFERIQNHTEIHGNYGRRIENYDYFIRASTRNDVIVYIPRVGYTY